MEKNSSKYLSMIALICSLFPLISYLLAVFKVTLNNGMQAVLASSNVLCILLGLGLSIICVRKEENHSVINIVAMVISILWLVLVAGIVGLALTLNFLH